MNASSAQGDDRPSKGSLPTSDVEAYWKEYYTKVAHDSQSRPVPWLDYSNERVQAQTFALILEATGSPYGRRCLDAGCGWGHLSRMFQALGSHVIGMDLNPVTITTLQAQVPGIRWYCGSILDPRVMPAEDPFDLVVAAEVLQYVPLEEALSLWWPRVRPGGRLVGVVPNAGCPIVQRTMARFEGRYLAVTAERVARALSGLSGHDRWAMRGLVFRQDQQLWPYETTPWSAGVQDDHAKANRLLFTVQRESKPV